MKILVYENSIARQYFLPMVNKDKPARAIYQIDCFYGINSKSEYLYGGGRRRIVPDPGSKESGSLLER